MKITHLITASLLLCIGLPATADNNESDIIKIATVQKLYAYLPQMIVIYEKQEKSVDNMPLSPDKMPPSPDEILYENATPSLKAAMDLELKNPELYKEEEDEYMPENILWGFASIDEGNGGMEYEEVLRTIKHQVMPTGEVKTTFKKWKGQDDKTVIFYKLECNEKMCLFDDVILWEENSLKKEVIETYKSLVERKKQK